MQQIRKRGKQVKENATEPHFRRFRLGEKKKSGNPILWGEPQ